MPTEPFSTNVGVGESAGAKFSGSKHSHSLDSAISLPKCYPEGSIRIPLQGSRNIPSTFIYLHTVVYPIAHPRIVYLEPAFGASVGATRSLISVNQKAFGTLIFYTMGWVVPRLVPESHDRICFSCAFHKNPSDGADRVRPVDDSDTRH